MTAEEQLLVMGIANRCLAAKTGVALFPVVDFPAERTGKRAIVNEAAVRKMCGNGMHLSAIGACLLFALGSTRGVP